MKVSIPTSFLAVVTTKRGSSPTVIQRKVLADVYKAIEQGGYKLRTLSRQFANGDIEKI